ncbi:hypothetical protein, conserved [Leishmania tarentolae]|uniref:Uncharacterized protein n=1 Tax=Leishmania tarentolae TaxID=5689 RepID=A0A640KL58_LEITA|nr:hypothetical protein, conserved [Leishmania tarentolae]
MATLSEDEIAPSAIAAERERLQEATQHILALEKQLDALHRELEAARTRREHLLFSVQWRELMAAVNADEDVYAVAERMMDAFAGFRESLVEPENYLQEQREEALNEEDIVPYSDTDDYADFSGVEAVAEELLATVKEQLDSHAAVPSPSLQQRNRSSLGGSFAWSQKLSGSDGGSTETQKVDAAARRQALLMLLVITVLMGRVEQYCGFNSISDASNVPQTDAEEIRDGVVSVWQWLFHEKPGVLTEEEGAEWKHIADTFLGDSYTMAP